jgi:hypothetical protein
MAVALELGNDHNLSVDVFLACGDVPFLAPALASGLHGALRPCAKVTRAMPRRRERQASLADAAS